MSLVVLIAVAIWICGIPAPFFFLFIYSPIIVNTIVTFGYTATGDLSKLYYLSFSEEIRNHSVRGGEWSFKNYESHKILVGFHTSRSLVFFSGYVRLAVWMFS